MDIIQTTKHVNFVGREKTETEQKIPANAKSAVLPPG